MKSRSMNPILLVVPLGMLVLVSATPLAAQEQTFAGTGFGLVNVAAGQTLRMIVVDVGNSIKPNDTRQRVELAFDVYRLNEVGPPDDGRTSCLTWQFEGRQSCAAMLGPGHAASFDFLAPATGLFSVRAVYVLPKTATRGGATQDEFIATLQLMEGGRTIFVHEHSSINR